MASPIQGQETATAIERLVGFQVLERGHWRQENPDASPGDETPTHWVRQVAWGPGRDVVLADAFAVYRDGRCESVSHMVYYWDHRTARVGLRSFGPGGVVGEGHIVALGPYRNQLTASVRLPDGSEMRIRDTSDRSRPGAYSTRAERQVAGEWVSGDSVVWRMESAPSPCSER